MERITGAILAVKHLTKITRVILPHPCGQEILFGLQDQVQTINNRTVLPNGVLSPARTEQVFLGRFYLLIREQGSYSVGS